MTTNEYNLAASTPTTSVLWYLAGEVEKSAGIRRVPINSSPFVVGRRSDAGLSVPSGSVSKNHAEIVLDGDSAMLRDLDSTNGTYVNGERISQATALKDGDLVQFAKFVFRVGQESKAMESRTVHEDACQNAMTLMQFDRLINDGNVVPFFQPLVDVQKKSLFGFEVLGRSRLRGMSTPNEMFAAAAKLNLEFELSAQCRLQGVISAEGFPAHANFFVNTHPSELTNTDFFKSLEQLRELTRDRLITIEIHEAASADVEFIRELRVVLNELKMMLAFDDFGTGKARLIELAEAQPDFVKFDIQLIRQIHNAPSRRQEMVATLVRMVNGLGIVTLAEGIESSECHKVICDMGFQLGQGFYYGKPEPAEHYFS